MNGNVVVSGEYYLVLRQAKVFTNLVRRPEYEKFQSPVFNMGMS